MTDGKVGYNLISRLSGRGGGKYTVFTLWVRENVYVRRFAIFGNEIKGQKYLSANPNQRIENSTRMYQEII
jgi:hypothetical protein